MKEKHLIKDREKGCPLGHRCDDCNWYRPLYTVASNGEYVAEYDCQINHLALLQAETKDRLLGVQQATEAARNRMTEIRDDNRKPARLMPLRSLLDGDHPD